MVGGHDGAERLGPQHTFPESGRGRGGESGQHGERDAVVEEPPLDVVAAVLQHLEPHAGVGGGELGERCGQERAAEARGREEGEASFVEASGGTDGGAG